MSREDTSGPATAGGGLHWLPFSFILAVIIAASNAWMLLVEVLR